MVGAGDPAAPAARRFGRHDSLVLGVALVLVLIIIGVAVTVYQHRSAALPPPTPSVPGQPPPVVTPSGQRVPSSSVSRRELGRAALPDTAGYEIIGLGPQGLVRLNPGRGTVIETAATANLTGGAAVVAGRGFVIGGATDGSARYVFPDEQPARRTTNFLAQAAQFLSGPTLGQVWVVTQNGSGEQPVVRAVDVDGTPVAASIPVPYGAEEGFSFYADGTGQLVIAGLAGWYASGPTGLRRVTSGTLLAIGPTRWLTADCDDAGRCQLTVTDRSTGTRTVLPGSIPTDVYFPGLISPDGRWAALGTQRDHPGALTLVDLTTGRRRTAELEAQGPLPAGQMVWSPDSRWLLGLDQRNGLVGVDPSTGRATPVAGDLPSLTAITVRPG